jgi:hypothetical protein
VRLLIIVSFLLLACGPSSSAPPAAPSTQPPAAQPPATQPPAAQPPATQPPAAQPPATPPRSAPVERNIYLDTVEVANPVIVTGRARTFENNVVLRVRDARGALIAETFTTSTGEMGHHNPYRGTLWVTRDPGGEVTVEALDYSAKDGSERDLVSETRPYPVDLIDATLYLPDANCTAVHPKTRRLPKSLSHARLLLEALLTGPPFPSGSRVESVNLRNGVLTVDFNERLQNVGGSCQAQMIRESVTRTLQTLPSVKKVVITAGGSEKLALQP